MSKHTPGPWGQLGRKRNEHKTIPLRAIYCEALGYHVAFVSDDRDGETRANARLIAAAPDMLDMLKRLHKAGGIWPDLLPALQAVIAKATGEDND